MSPGVISIEASHNAALPLQLDQLVCIRAYNRESNSPPMAVGRMAMASNLVEGTDKGKAVLTMHTYGDVLWEKGGKAEPPTELTIVQSIQLGEQVPAEESTGRPSQVEQNEAVLNEAQSQAGEDLLQNAAQGEGSSTADLEQIPAEGIS